jgi:hypothetical protein
VERKYDVGGACSFNRTAYVGVQYMLEGHARIAEESIRTLRLYSVTSASGVMRSVMP